RADVGERDAKSGEPLIFLRREQLGDEPGGVYEPPERVAASGEMVPGSARPQPGVDPHQENLRAIDDDVAERRAAIGDDVMERRAAITPTFRAPRSVSPPAVLAQTSQSFLAIFCGMYTSVTKLMSLLESASI